MNNVMVVGMRGQQVVRDVSDHAVPFLLLVKILSLQQCDWWDEGCKKWWCSHNDTLLMQLDTTLCVSEWEWESQ